MTMYADVASPLDEALLSCLAPADSHGRVRSTILVQDSLQLSGMFVVQASLRRALQAGQQVPTVLVAVEHSADRYKQMLRKLGLPLQPFLDSGQLMIESAPEPLPSHTQPCPSALQQLVQRLHVLCLAKTSQPRQQAESGKQGGAGQAGKQFLGERRDGAAPAGLTMVIDSLSDLVPLATSAQEWMTFVAYCTALGANLAGRMTQVLRVHLDVPDDQRWVGWLAHHANLVLEVQPLAGPIADIDGQVLLSFRRAVSPVVLGGSQADGERQSKADIAAAVLARPLPEPSRLYFRGAETGIKWFRTLVAQDLLWR
ncbi:hypothetical protein V8C86DRAFT_2733495 [Haematococcus lacustris]